MCGGSADFGPASTETNPATGTVDIPWCFLRGLVPTVAFYAAGSMTSRELVEPWSCETVLPSSNRQYLEIDSSYKWKEKSSVSEIELKRHL